jgi:hypothetical protein
MSLPVKEILRASRPPGPPGRGDKYLADIALDLRRLLERTQRGFANRSVKCPDAALAELTVALVGFGEDVHADIGLWRSLEDYHREFFGTPLPLSIGAGATEEPAAFDPRRVQHLIWTLWMNPEVLPSPAHPNVLQLAQVTGTFLSARFAGLPADSGVKHFLAGPSQFGWEIKRKLVWLGTESYLFRILFARKVLERKEGATIGVKDDFICQESTVWSGLGAIDILAGALDVSAEDRATLRTWYERHLAIYRVLSRQDRDGKTEFIVVRNLVNQQPYTVRMDVPQCPFEPGQVVYGSLTPWRGEWYWSGEQRTYGQVPESKDPQLRREMLELNSSIAYRYCPAEAEQARASNRKNYADFVAYCGGDLVVYPDGLALAAAEQKRMETLWRAADPDHVSRVMRERGLTQPRPTMRFPREILDHEQGIGVFYNPDEGQEIMLGFNHVLSGLRKQGEGLTDAERDALDHFMKDRAVSPAFVQRLVREHGAASLLDNFQLRRLPPDLALALLLRCHKGRFYRNRYPSVSLVESGKL